MDLVLSLKWIELKNLACWFVVILDCSLHKPFNRLSTLFQACLSKKPHPPWCASLFSLTCEASTTSGVNLESVDFQPDIVEFSRYTLGTIDTKFWLCVLKSNRLMVEYRASIFCWFSWLSSRITWKTWPLKCKILEFSCKKCFFSLVYAIFKFLINVFGTIYKLNNRHL